MRDLVGDLLALVGRGRHAQTSERRRTGPAHKPRQIAGPQSGGPQKQPQRQQVAKQSTRPQSKEVKSDEVIPFDEDFGDF
jgi:hypothetical protein